MNYKYKIVFLDIDGTLTNSDKEITLKTLSSLKRIQEEGVKLAIASGRPSKGVIPYAEILELEKYSGYILPFNGGRVINYGSKEVIYENTLSSEVLKKAYEVSKQYNVDIITYKGDYILSETEDNPYLIIEATINKMDVIKVDNLLEAVEEMPVKCLLLGDGDYLEKVESEIRDKIGENANVFRSEPFFLEVVPKGIDKAASISELISKIGIKREETVAFGDGYNDVSMVKYVGLGVAMANGCDAIKEIADVVTADNNSDGIADVINDIF